MVSKSNKGISNIFITPNNNKNEDRERKFFNYHRLLQMLYFILHKQVYNITRAISPLK